MTVGEREEWDSMVENIQTAAVAGLARNTDRRDLPSNLIAATDTPCFNSFRNISRAGFLVTDHQVNRNFGTLIQAVFTDGDLDDLATADIIAKEKVYMERFRYEYFITNIGAAEYKGAGSSLKKTSTMTQGSGTAYKIYGCGYLMPDKTAPDDFDDPDILVPLESVIVLSN
jgi:rubrerythrin